MRLIILPCPGGCDMWCSWVGGEALGKGFGDDGTEQSK